ncbi:hypothetical protein B0J18DRAFT_172783 [Chaetomium sp. MPI-SDFR-AT-0129]|nr:hypothetical protein B0J18DRAFT_172783 [Chaetomium sp. MPI-SDFR-AT-0129]
MVPGSSPSAISPLTLTPAPRSLLRRQYIYTLYSLYICATLVASIPSRRILFTIQDAASTSRMFFACAACGRTRCTEYRTAVIGDDACPTVLIPYIIRSYTSHGACQPHLAACWRLCSLILFATRTQNSVTNLASRQRGILWCAVSVCQSVVGLKLSGTARYG